MKDKTIDATPPKNYFKLGKSMLFVWGLWPLELLSPVRKKLYQLYGILLLFATILPYNICSAVDAFYQIQMGNWMEIMPRFSVSLAIFLGFIKVSVCAFHTKTINGFMSVYEKEQFTWLKFSRLIPTFLRINYSRMYTATNFFRPNDIINKCIWLYNIQLAVCFGVAGILIMTDVDTYLKDPMKSNLVSRKHGILRMPYFLKLMRRNELITSVVVLFNQIVLPDNTTIPALPFVNWLPYDYTSTPAYEVSFCLTNFWFFVSANLIIVYDTICMGLMIHTSGQLKILKEALITIRLRAFLKAQEPINNASPTETEINEAIKIMFRKCAVHHQAIINCTAAFERIYSAMIFMQFCISCLMVCFTILIVTNYDSPMSSRVTSLIILMCSMWELSVYCYFGNEIISESNQLALAIYKSSWYAMDQNIKYDMLLMMTRCQKPIVFTAGRFVPLSLETFIKILKASYSYYAFLRSVSNSKT